MEANDRLKQHLQAATRLWDWMDENEPLSGLTKCARRHEQMAATIAREIAAGRQAAAR